VRQASAFDDLATSYDAAFTDTAVGKALREIVWSHLDDSFGSCRRILDLGCGTGADAVRLARGGATVIATDASPRMLQVARQKAHAGGCDTRIEFHCVAMESLAQVIDGQRFDGVLSNFGAVNCAPDLPGLVADVSRRLAPGGKLLWVVMGRHVPWEWLWYLLRGEWRRAWRRLAPEGASWRGLTIHYPTPSQLQRILRPQFAIDRVSPLGCVLPPTYASGWLERSPRALAVLTYLEKFVQRSSACAAFSDHYIIEATRLADLPDDARAGERTPCVPGILNTLRAYAQEHAGQLVRFGIVGAGLAALNLLLLYILRTGLGLPDPVAITLTYVLGGCAHFASHRRITYLAQHQPIPPALWRYLLMFAGNFAIMQAVFAATSRLGLSPYFAVVGSTAITMISNFLIMAHVIFRKRAGAMLADRPLGGAAQLPPAVTESLRQRGIGDDSVRMVHGLLADPAHLSGADGSAVVVMLDHNQAEAAEPLLTQLAAAMQPDTLLVLSMATLGRSPDPREATHLMLLRAGYDRVWVDRRGTQLCVSARRARSSRAGRVLSIIVPVFDERGSFPQLMRSLLAKRLDHLGLEREIILVEGHSTDGTRELVEGFRETPGVKILWQDRPRGKGHAVRMGLQVATGDIVLIQDADLEYDVNDYDALLEPLLNDRAAFVLGSRHTSGAGIRKFTDQRLLGMLLNAGHVFFTTLINVLYRQKLKDPFTMFKVFRRDCLHGLQFECDRFDFDHELVIKLVLKGYRPLEIPVNYRSRSFRQGKKIRPLRDAFTWIIADLKYRFERPRPRLD
jgi:SAM-dependent methyltransferase/putative flippase GtrA